MSLPIADKMVATLLSLLLMVTPVLAADVNLSVASSLKEVLDELSNRFVQKHPGVKLFKNYGASGALAKQIESGAPSDVFMPANLEWMDYLKHKKLVDSTSIGTFTYNTLVFSGVPGKVSSMHDLMKMGRIAIGSPRSVPAGEYAMEAVKKAGLDKQLAKKFIIAKDARESLMYAERGEVDGAFVYRTDALQAKKVKILFTVPQTLYPRVTYPVSLTIEGAKNRNAVAFFAYLHSNEAKSVLTKYGFETR